MYERVPTKELAIESINWPLTPKSQILISPFEFTNILEGFTSANDNKQYKFYFANMSTSQLKVFYTYKETTV